MKKALAWTVGCVGGFVAVSIGLHYADILQTKFNKTSKEIVANSSGGELGHIAAVYDVLDKTDPARYEGHGGGYNIHQNEAAWRDIAMANAPKPDPTLSLPLLPAVWTLDLASAKIPEGRANGTLAGTNFTIETVQVARAGFSEALSFQQGVGTTADRELFIYLNASGATNLAGRSWNISPEMKGKDVPQIMKRWTANPKYAPIAKNYNTGYALKFDIGQPTNGWLPARIFLALPDTNQTVVAGAFSISAR